jgi:hypothetical protein
VLSPSRGPVVGAQRLEGCPQADLGIGSHPQALDERSADGR